MNLLKVLFVSWSIGAGLPYLSELTLNIDKTVDYQLKCILPSLIYMFMTGYCYHLFKHELRLKRKLDSYLIAAICFCMIISSLFNYLFVFPDMYHLLLDARRGDGLSWKNIYTVVEIVALLTVGKNGIIYIYNRLVCSNRRFSVIIANNSKYKIGR